MTIRKIPVIYGDIAVDMVDESRALQMRRHSPYVRLKRDKHKQIVRVFINAPALTDRDWRERSRPQDNSLVATKEETVPREAEGYSCDICGEHHGGLGRGRTRIVQHKTPMITRQWRNILQHEMRPLYKTARQ